MPTLHLICHGTLKEQYLRDACAEYQKRLSAFCKVELYEAKDDESLAAKIPSKGLRIALCVEGKQLSSEELAAKMDTAMQSGASDLTFVIGGSEGLPESTKALCDFRLSFSKMTFPHQLMRVILLEQIYRAFTILKGITYHK